MILSNYSFYFSNIYLFLVICCSVSLYKYFQSEFISLVNQISLKWPFSQASFMKTILYICFLLSRIFILIQKISGATITMVLYKKKSILDGFPRVYKTHLDVSSNYFPYYEFKECMKNRKECSHFLPRFLTLQHPQAIKNKIKTKIILFFHYFFYHKFYNGKISRLYNILSYTNYIVQHLTKI